MSRCVGQASVELRRSNLHAVKQRTPFEVERQRDDGDPARACDLRGQVGRRVGDDGDFALAHGGTTSVRGSSRALLCLAGKKRLSTQRSAVRVIRTNAAEIADAVK